LIQLKNVFEDVLIANSRGNDAQTSKAMVFNKGMGDIDEQKCLLRQNYWQWFHLQNAAGVKSWIETESSDPVTHQSAQVSTKSLLATGKESKLVENPAIEEKETVEEVPIKNEIQAREEIII
jgi:hypothetical protein